VASVTPADPLGAFCPGPRVVLDGAPSGPLAGLAFAAKDNFDVAGFVTGAGNPDWLRTHPPATRTATAVKRLLDAGARLAGKTIMDELAFGSVGENRHYGTPANPAAPGRVPGGSSSGSASAVAGGAVDFALGTDSACSVRLPASLCGLYGIRPTHGRVSVEGVVPLSPSLDTVGWLARSGEVLRRVGRVLLEPAPPAPPPARVLVPDDALALARPEVVQALSPAIDRVAAAIGAVEHVSIGEPGTERAVERFLLRSAVRQVHEVWACHGEWIESARPDSAVLSRDNLRVGAEATAEQIADAIREWEALRAWIRAGIPPGSVVVLPTAIDVAPLRGLSIEERARFTRQSLTLLSIAVLGGLPQVSVPAARVDGLPVGLSLVGAPGADERLLEIAARFDQPEMRSTSRS
jgi:amidase